MSYSKFKTKSLSTLGTYILKVIAFKNQACFEAGTKRMSSSMGGKAELLGSVVISWLKSKF